MCCPKVWAVASHGRVTQKHNHNSLPPCNLPATPFLVTPFNSATEVVLKLRRQQKKNSFLSSITGSKRGKYCCCYTPLWPPIKDAGDGCRRGCQSGRGPWGEQKAGGGVAQPWPGHNDQGLTLQTYHHTHASNHDTHREGGRAQRGS